MTRTPTSAALWVNPVEFAAEVVEIVVDRVQPVLPGLDQEGVERHPERACGRRPRQSSPAYLVNHQQKPRAIACAP